MAGPSWRQDEWELCNDNGFVYKRRKRQRTQEAPTEPEQPFESQAELKRRKKNTIKKLKDKYQKELHDWGILSNTLQDMDEKYQKLQNQTQTHTQQSLEPSSDPEKSRSQDILDEFLLQLETQEAILKDISSLCDVFESIYEKDEERSKQWIFDLPVWGSPRGLLASLSDEDYCNHTSDNT